MLKTADPDDLTLLRRYANDRCADAFATLVARHADFVLATALRQMRSRDLAEDVMQATFIVLARRASSLRDGTSVAGFLHQTAVYASKNLLRAQSRRRHHEARAAEEAMRQKRSDPSDPAAEFVEADPVAVAVDRALTRLRWRDRQLLMLHYFDGFSVPEAAT